MLVAVVRLWRMRDDALCSSSSNEQKRRNEYVQNVAAQIHFVRFLVGKGRSEVAGESCRPLPDRSCGAVWISGRVVRKGEVWLTGFEPP